MGNRDRQDRKPDTASGLSFDVGEIYRGFVADGFPECPELEAYAGQVARLREAQSRLAREGLIIADQKGNPVEHPCLVIERAAQKEILSWEQTVSRWRRQARKQ